MFPALLAALPGILTAGKGLYDMFGHHKNPADGAINELDQIPGKVKPYYDPYMTAGKDSLDKLKGEYDTLTSNPGGKYNDLVSGYKQSPGYANTLREALGASDAGAARGGSLGSAMHQQNNAEVAGNVADKDFENYVKNVLGLYGTGITGNEGIEKQGYDASTGYGNLVGNVGGQKGAYRYMGDVSTNKGNSQNWGNVVGGFGTALQGYNDTNATQSLMNWLKSHQTGGQ